MHERTQQEIEEMETAQDCEHDDYLKREAALKAFIEAADALRYAVLELQRIKITHIQKMTSAISGKLFDAVQAYDAARAKLGG